jgi:hypothetical protein
MKSFRNPFTGLLSLTIILASSSSAFAGGWGWIPMLPGQERHTYKASEVQQIDIETFCQNKLEGYNGARRDGDAVICQRPGIKKFDGGLTINRGTDIGVNVKQDSEMVNVEKRFTVNDLCDFKHPGIGAFAGDGGSACYDSYRK